MSLLKYVTVSKTKRRKMDQDGTEDSKETPKTREDSPIQIHNFSLTEKKGDLFSCADTDALTHCISEDCRMGKGIAVLFKRKFGGVQELLDQKQKTGGVAVLKRGQRFVYYLITKEKYWNKPTYQTLRNSLEAMRSHCQKNRVTNVSMPRIGCGLDGLNWNKVVEIVKGVFSNTDISITVFTL